MPQMRDKKGIHRYPPSIKKERENKEIGTNKIRNWGKIQDI